MENVMLNPFSIFIFKKGYKRGKRLGANPKTPEQNRKSFLNTIKKTGKWRGVKKTVIDLR